MQQIILRTKKRKPWIFISIVMKQEKTLIGEGSGSLNQMAVKIDGSECPLACLHHKDSILVPKSRCRQTLLFPTANLIPCIQDTKRTSLQSSFPHLLTSATTFFLSVPRVWNTVVFQCSAEHRPVALQANSSLPPRT